MSEKNKRELVKECIEKGSMTKAEIAEHLSMSVASVSTQMTYLRWMENYILTDAETKIITFTDKETFEKLEAEKKANRKTKSVSTRTPEERAVATAKTIINQNKQLVKWQEKLALNNELAEDNPEDADIELNIKEAIAQIALLEVKLVRNEKLADELPDPVVDEPADAEEAPVDPEGDGEDLL